MRILLLSNLYPPDVQGGAEILAADIAGGLEQLGHEVLVLTSSAQGDSGEPEEHIWRTLKSAPPAHFDRRRSPWQQLNLLSNYYRRYHRPANAQELLRLIEQTRPDVLYIWEITGIGVTSLLKVLPAVTIPIVFHLGSYWLLYAQSPETEQSRLNTRWLKQWLIGTPSIPASTSLIAVSGTVKEKYVQGGFDPEHIEVIYNGIDPQFFTMPRAEGKKVPGELLFVGRLRVEKGLLVLLKAMHLLLSGSEQLSSEQMREQLHLNVYGDGDQVYINELQRYIQEKGLERIVTFHGRIPQEELIHAYDRADLMLVPSLWQEPFGLVIAEAMARGVPVIASKVGGPAEIITNEVDSLLVEPENEKELALAIKRLLEDPRQREQLSQAAQQTAQTRFTIQENAKRVEQHLLRVLQKGEKTPAPI